jgi:hypothetical protein
MKSALDIIYDQARSIQMLQEKVNTLQSELEKVVLQLSVKNNTERSLTCSCRSERNVSSSSYTINREEPIPRIIIQQNQSRIKTIEEPENRTEQSIEKKQDKFLTDNSLIDHKMFVNLADSHTYEKEIENFQKVDILISPINKNLDLTTPKEKNIRLDLKNIHDVNITTTSVDKSSRIKPLGISISGIDMNFDNYREITNRYNVYVFYFRMMRLVFLELIIIMNLMREKILTRNLILN